jgi:Ca2+-binding RTX toxin-like protein
MARHEDTGTFDNDPLLDIQRQDYLRGDQVGQVINGTRRSDELFGGAGNDIIDGGRGKDFIHGGAGNDVIFGGRGRDSLEGGSGNDHIFGGRGRDVIEAGSGDDLIVAGRGRDTVLSMSWAGEPEIAQDDQAEKVEPDEPIADDDIIALGIGADTLIFRWLIDARDSILDKHRDDDGNVNYRKVAGENDNVHDHWVEGIGNDVVLDYDARKDTLVFEGHTVTLADIQRIDADDDGRRDDSVAHFYSEQGGAGAHQDDELGSVTFIDYQISAAEIDINRGVFYGVEDPYSAVG